MGQMRVDAAIGALIVGGQPLFVALFAHFMKKDDKMNIRKALSILLGLVGLVVVAMGKVDEISVVGWTSIIGILFLIGNNVSSGISNVIISRVHTHDIKPLVFSSYAQICTISETKYNHRRNRWLYFRGITPCPSRNASTCKYDPPTA